MSYSPHHEGGGMLHVASPSQHGYRIDGFPSIRQLRRSLSRSPSKSSRFQLYNATSPSRLPDSPLSPLALTRAFSPKKQNNSPPFNASPSSPLAPQTVPAPRKAKLTFRRAPPFRSSPRAEPPVNQPTRSALSDISNQRNVTPSKAKRMKGEENEEISPSEAAAGLMSDRKSHGTKLELNDGPIKFEFVRPKLENVVPVKSSPLKRSDGIMNTEHANFGSPVAKRRSLHGAFLGTDFDIFEHGRISAGESENHGEDDKRSTTPLSSPHRRRPSPLRKSLSLRKSTLQQRYVGGPVRPRLNNDQYSDFVSPSAATSRARQRMSLDSTWLSGVDSPPFSQKRLQLTETPTFASQPTQRYNVAHNQPHPLSNTLTPSPSVSKSTIDLSQMPPPEGPIERVKIPHSKSLPIGATRPTAPTKPDVSQETENSFATPDGYKSAKPLPAAFMSTGLISKRNRNIDNALDNSLSSYAMPDTPSKRSSFPPVSTSPYGAKFTKHNRSRPEFGTPTTPFSPHTVKPFMTKGVSIFGTRLDNFKESNKPISSGIVGEDASQLLNDQMDSQSSNDELPPTPTKNAGESRPRSKGNSLRSSLFGRRASLGPETFLPPSEAVTVDSDADNVNFGEQSGSQCSSPHTPHESFTPPDPSSLSISGESDWKSSLPYFKGTTSRGSFPPATPTTSREQGFSFAIGGGGSILGISAAAGVKNEVDTSITSRFTIVQSIGNGEFSQVFRVERPIAEASATMPNPAGKIWAIKKSRKPFAGPRDRERKLQEANILKVLRGGEHVIEYVDSWESKGHLYIQTDFCENGDLKTFLTQTGYRGRLDDFRIWKILLELVLGVKHIHHANFIHLDLKPANIFIDRAGVLKIGDFGLASPWPVLADIDGEGDREYIGPEVLCGRFDKPADIFSLGMIMIEIAGNIILPDNGTSWQHLRAGDLSDLPGLTYSAEHILERDQHGDPIGGSGCYRSIKLVGGTFSSDDDHDDSSSIGNDETSLHQQRRRMERTTPPNFMVSPDDAGALDQLVRWMISPVPENRPTVNALPQVTGVQWVERRRRAGATVYEGNWGPADDGSVHEWTAGEADGMEATATPGDERGCQGLGDDRMDIS